MASGDLVFDIGLNNGDDAAYYLHLGYRVVGIEANPLLAAQCAQRFENDIEQGRMTVVNVGVLKEPGVFTFHRNLLDDEWSSFEPEKRGEAGEWEKISVACVTTHQLIAAHGTPFFMKVDIEGSDLQAFESLAPSTAPCYVSVELNAGDPTIEKLTELGYSGFKFVEGGTFCPPPIFDHQIGLRLLRKAGRIAPFVRSAIASLPQRFRAKSEWCGPGIYSPDGYPFTSHSSGPFGEQAAGRWLTPAAALRCFRDLKHYFRKSYFWWDVHARHSSANR